MLREWTGGVPYTLTARDPFTHPPPRPVKKESLFPNVGSVLPALQRFLLCSGRLFCLSCGLVEASVVVGLHG